MGHNPDIINVLIVEDDLDTALTLQHFIEMEGHRADRIVSNGEDALNAAAEDDFSLALMDISLPGTLDGLTTAKTLRESYELPVILVSGHTEPETLSRARKSGADSFLLKPVSAGELRVAMGMVMAKFAVEQQLAKQKALQSTVLSAVPCGIIFCETSGIIRFANTAAAELLNMLETDLQNQHIAHCLHLKETTSSECSLADWLKSPNAKPQDTRSGRLLTRETQNEDVFVEICRAPVLDDNELLSGYIIVINNITQRYLWRARAIQGERFEAISRMASELNHDFNNILGVIKTYAGLIERQLPSEGNGLRLLEKLKRATDQGIQLAQHLGDYSRNREYNPTKVDLVTVIEDTASLLQSMLPQNITLKSNCDLRAAPIYADAFRIQRTLMNLCLNARDAMPDGGVLRLALHRTERPAGDDKLQEMFCLCVEDSGKGIKESDIELIFDPFFTTKKEGKGTGLGLAIVMDTLQRAKGTVEVDSEVGKGTCFRLFFPHHQEAILSEEETAELMNH